ncbi:DUF1788 domain-containing protein [Tardiphaga sp. 71_E8_N1_1]|uniref:DUF1788 domain-containing protein n=1 Tax=Tardiphaga sp. 71_E8_N1_1 TaxID=3240784 RepID=UPI003F8A9D78
MNVAYQKFNDILDRLTSNEMLEGRGRGNEIGFYIFDYLPEDELNIREAIPFLLQNLPRRRPGLRVAHVNLFDLIIEHLEERKLLAKAIEQARKKGDGFLLKALANPLAPQKIARVFEQKCPPDDYDLFLLSGAGSVFPVLRTHSLLTALHPVIQDKPLVLFFPGTYDGLSLKLFGKLKDDNYYRAFKLLPDRGRQ